MDPNSARPHPTDDALPVFAHLLHERTPGPVVAVYDAAGTTIEDISRIQVSWLPGQNAILRYRIDGSGGELAGRRDLVATVGSIPEGAAVVAGPDGDVGLWVVPNDPLLPGLPSALHRPTVARLLSDLGSTAEVAGIRLRSYRPGRRAVVEVSAGGTSIFLKVVPPAEARGLHERHRHLTHSLPVPDSLGVSPDLGNVALRALPGVDLRTIIR
ncbi:MAG TPA: aminoglycoside phosphotransferase family protein, partial [Acidimicrobiia bacterium]